MCTPSVSSDRKEASSPLRRSGFAIAGGIVAFARLPDFRSARSGCIGAPLAPRPAGRPTEYQGGFALPRSTLGAALGAGALFAAAPNAAASTQIEAKHLNVRVGDRAPVTARTLPPRAVAFEIR